MAASYKKTVIQAYPRIGEQTTRDTLYWKELQFPFTRKEFGAVSHIDFRPKSPYNFAVTSASKVQVISGGENRVLQSLTRFKEGATCANYRHDGQLLVAGSKEGVVRLYQESNKSMLRAFKGHTRPTNVAKFLSDNVRLVTASDDQTVRVWDVAQEEQTRCYSEHKDYVRCGATSKASKDIFLTGSYDHTLKMFDARCPKSTLSLNHGHPVESVLIMPSGGIFISAGGPVIKVWDALAGGKLLTTFGNHHKTITCMCFCSRYQRLVSGSLDRHLKIYDITNYQVVHTMDYPSAILSVGIAPDDSSVVVGMVDGLLSIQNRKSPEEAAKLEMEKKQLKKRPSYRYRVAGKVREPSKEDFVVELKRKEELEKYDRYFKRFEYSKALDAAMDIRIRMRSPEVTVSVMQELIRRGGLRASLSGRDERSLINIITFLHKNLRNPRYITTLLDVSSILLDLYSEQIGESSTVDSCLSRLKETVNREVKFMKNLMEMMGAMDTLFAVSEETDVTEDSPPIITSTTLPKQSIAT